MQLRSGRCAEFEDRGDEGMYHGQAVELGVMGDSVRIQDLMQTGMVLRPHAPGRMPTCFR
jgi:hypothetical protein